MSAPTADLVDLGRIGAFVRAECLANYNKASQPQCSMAG